MFNKRKPEVARAHHDPATTISRSIAPSAQGKTENSPKYDGQVTIGRGTKIIGEIQDCAVVEIQGTVEGTISAKSLVILAGGQVSGQITAENAEVHGAFAGNLKIESLLDVKSTGRVEGDLAYGQLSVAMGGNVVGYVTNPPPGSQTSDANQTEVDNRMTSEIRAFRPASGDLTQVAGNLARTR